MHTAGDHARTMLQTCEQLAAGMGAPATKGQQAGGVMTGNVRLGLWVGERYLGTLLALVAWMEQMC